MKFRTPKTKQEQVRHDKCPSPHQSNTVNPIEKDRVEITIERDSNAKAAALVVNQLNLSELGLNEKALVSVVAYSDIFELRHPLGTVDALALGSRIDLSLLDTARDIVVRILVAAPDDFLLLASCEGIRANEDGEAESGQKPLLPVEYGSLGESLWTVEHSGGSRPILVLNADHALDLRAKFDQRDPVFRALIVPKAIEQALLHLALYPPPDDDETHWQNLWLKSLDLLEMERPPELIGIDDIGKIMAWVKETARDYATKLKLGTAAAVQFAGVGNG